MKQKKHEVKPLLNTDIEKSPENERPRKPRFTNIHAEHSLKDNAKDSKMLLKVKKGRSVSSIFTDAFILTLEFLQMFAVVQSMAMRWYYPKGWLDSSSFVFFFNLDIWEFLKLITPRVYHSVQEYQIPSTLIPIKYEYILLLWLLLLFLLASLYVVLFCILKVRQRPSFYLRFARLQKICLVVAQCLSLPAGLAVFRLFLCNVADKVDVLNHISCFQGSHWGYLVPALLLILFLFVVLPALLFIKIWREVVSSNSRQHEIFIYLKESEYMYGLNTHWIYRKLFFFSSFSYWGVYYIPITFVIKLGVLIIYTVGFYGFKTQPITAAVVFGFAFLAFLAVRPFRMRAFNVMLIWNYLILCAFSTYGSFITFVDSSRVRSSWLVEPYSSYILVVLIGLWCVVWVMFVFTIAVHLLNRYTRWCRCSLPFFKDKPALKPHTRKYIKALLMARQTLERIKRMPCLFAPVHELVHQIHIINAYYREAEFLQDPLHNALWELLDDMIEVHSQMAPKSVFSETVKESVRQTSFELMKLMPTFARKVNQRDFDFILMSPLKKRILLKMLCLATFINGKKDRAAKRKQLGPIADRIWKPPPDEVELAESDGYYGHLYPVPLDIPDYRPFSNAALQIDLNDLNTEESSGDELTGLLGNIEDIPKVKITQNASRPDSGISYKSSRSDANGRSMSGKVQDEVKSSAGSIPGQVPDDCDDDDAADGESLTTASKRDGEINGSYDPGDEQHSAGSKDVSVNGSQLSVESERNRPQESDQSNIIPGKSNKGRVGQKSKQKQVSRRK